MVGRPRQHGGRSTVSGLGRAAQRGGRPDADHMAGSSSASGRPDLADPSRGALTLHPARAAASRSRRSTSSRVLVDLGNPPAVFGCSGGAHRGTRGGLWETWPERPPPTSRAGRSASRRDGERRSPGLEQAAARDAPRHPAASDGWAASVPPSSRSSPRGRGKTNPEIASALTISRDREDSRVTCVDQLGLGSRSEIAAEFARRGSLG